MLPAPRGFGFILAAILGAMLVPGCRPDDGPSGPSAPAEAITAQLSSTQAIIPDQYIVVFESSLPDPAAEGRALVAQHGGTLPLYSLGSVSLQLGDSLPAHHAAVMLARRVDQK